MSSIPRGLSDAPNTRFHPSINPRRGRRAGRAAREESSAVTPSVLNSRLHRPNGAGVFSYFEGNRDPSSVSRSARLGNLTRRRLSVPSGRARTTGRKWRSHSPVGVRAVRRGVLRLSQYGVERPAVVIGIVILRRLRVRSRESTELRARHRRQTEQQYLRSNNYRDMFRRRGIPRVVCAALRAEFSAGLDLRLVRPYRQCP